MSTSVWEDMISLNSLSTPKFEVLGPASEYETGQAVKTWEKAGVKNIAKALKNDTFPLPETKDREGYYGPDHFGYWVGGLRDRQNLLDACKKYKLTPKSYMDMGCASGRVIRHFSANDPGIQTYGCDINRKHVEWVQQHLDRDIQIFQNHSIPTLPLPDNSIDLISAFSVFTHIEAFESTWLMELNRVMSPGGLAWVTVHTEKTWEDIDEDWPLYRGLCNHPDYKNIPKGSPLPSDRVVFRWRTDKSYSSNVFYTMDYIRQNWGRMFEVLEIRRRFPGFQDVAILRKRDPKKSVAVKRSATARRAVAKKPTTKKTAAKTAASKKSAVRKTAARKTTKRKPKK